MLTVLESLNYSFRNPKNIIWVIYRIKQLRNYNNKKNHGVLRGPQLGRQRWRARLGILRVNPTVAQSMTHNPLPLYDMPLYMFRPLHDHPQLHLFLTWTLEGGAPWTSFTSPFIHRERTPLPIEFIVGWAPKPVWTIWRRNEIGNVCHHHHHHHVR